MARRPVQASAYVQQVSAISNGGACGIDYPLRVAAFQNGAVGVNPDATIGCPLTEAVDGWMTESVQPAAIAWFGEPVAEIRQLSAYACRSRDNIPGARLSEHAFGNALDVAAFILPSGRKVTVENGWRGMPDEQGFLREVEATACQRFKTVLGPGEPYHGNHFHLDLAHHNAAGTSRYCKPTPQVIPPVMAPYGGYMATLPMPDQLLAATPDGGQAGPSDPVYQSQPAVAAPRPAWPPKPFFPWKPKPLVSSAWPFGAPPRPPAALGGLSYAD